MGKVNPRTLKRMLGRPGVHIEISQPFPIHGGRYMCLAKLVGHKRQLPRIQQLVNISGLTSMRVPNDEEQTEPDATETLCVVSEEGSSPADARRKLMRRLGDARNLPTAPPRARPGWLGRLIAAFK